MFLVRKKSSGLVSGMIMGAAVMMAIGSVFIMSNRTVKKEVTKEFMKLCDACGDIYHSII